MLKAKQETSENFFGFFEIYLFLVRLWKKILAAAAVREEWLCSSPFI